ncbi:TPA: hypothetical protein DIV55_06485 [Patescibacteria group bacterium]|uniref:Agarase n=1 Tax=Candidatus Curtissbacteria bacterium GW2011_GWA1_40_16 TaxID=1618405 RepID=A0A0G0RDU0_9BACT|nr:MAG: Agarase [Candidatus Curtissbacteria bacterium GW2011_GWA1_40_16]HCS79351.1 hypothetical protein [Patescibacteria group bacterium]
MSNNLINFHHLTKSQQNTVVVFGMSAVSMLFMGFLVVFIILAGKPGSMAAAPACSFNPTSVPVGGSLTVVSGGASGNINLQSNSNSQLVNVIGDLPKNGSVGVKLPVVPKGSYTISVGHAKLGSNGNVLCGTLNVTDQTYWVLGLPVVGANTAAFSFTPASNGSISLIVRSNNSVSSGTVVYDSGPIASGQTRVSWSNASAGSYSAALYFGSAPVSNTVSFTIKPPVPTVSITAASTNIPYNTSTTLIWNSANATACTISGGWFNAASVPTSGSISTGNITATTTYTLTCTGLGGSAKSSVAVTVQAPPSPTPTPVPTGGQWTLSQATVSGSTVTFNLTPASNGNVSLIVKSNNTVSNGTVVYDIGPIANGWTQVSWSNAPAGSYSAALYYATTAVSNTVNFNVQ